MYEEYIGRPSEWGNPFSHLKSDLAKYKVKDREESIQKYADWVIHQEKLMDKIHELDGIVLGCHCDPEDCHGSIIAYIAEYKNDESTYNILESKDMGNMNDKEKDILIQEIDRVVRMTRKVVVISGEDEYKSLVKSIVKHRNSTRDNKIYTIEDNTKDNNSVYYWGYNSS